MNPGPGASPARVALDYVLIGAGDLDRGVEVFRAICGTPPATAASSDGATEAWFRVGSQAVGLRSADESPSPGGVLAVGFDPGDRDVPTESLANTVPVRFGSRPALDAPPGDGRLDHVAVAVRDLRSAVELWAELLGVAPAEVGRHPLGSFDAARFLLGSSMIELVAPIDGVPSAVATRLGRAGEGVITVAIVADDLERTMGRIRDIGGRLVRSEPHWMVHPADACGVLVQLTPRLEH